MESWIPNLNCCNPKLTQNEIPLFLGFLKVECRMSGYILNVGVGQILTSVPQGVYSEGEPTGMPALEEKKTTLKKYPKLTKNTWCFTCLKKYLAIPLEILGLSINTKIFSHFLLLECK